MTGAVRKRWRPLTLMDRVYEHITLPPVVVEAIDTKHFQRLRGLKQLGVSSYLYPGAVHTRFEHSIGVAHLGRQFLNTLRQQQPELMVADRDVQNLMLAGLAHDLGHGPFSHLFEDVITHPLRQEGSTDAAEGITFDHEKMSLQLTRRMLEGIVDPCDIAAVETILTGKIDPENPDSKHPVVLSAARFSEIISNKRNGVDVDRIDYFVRDSMSCFGKPTVDVRVNRLFNSTALVYHPDSRTWELCFEEKMALTLRDLFGLRAKLHKYVYQHMVVKVVGHMIGDALRLAEPHFNCGQGTFLECAQDPDRFLSLGDWIVEAIEFSGDPKLQPAQKVLERIRRRQLYPMVFSRALDTSNPAVIGLSATKLKATILEEINSSSSDPAPRKVEDFDFIVDVVKIDHGCGTADPLSRISFFNPKAFRHGATAIDPFSLTRVKPHSSPLFSPSVFQERTLSVFCRSADVRDAVARGAERWAKSPEAANMFVQALPSLNTSLPFQPAP